MTRPFADASRLTLGATALFLADSFVAWQRRCFPAYDVCVARTLWAGIGRFAVWLAAALLLVEVIRAGGLRLHTNPVTRSLPVALALALAGATGGKLALDSASVSYGSFIGVALVVVIGYGTYARFLRDGARRKKRRTA